ncbi:hypothetical protein CAPTEDRAFT_217519 [Capitella teleta]|uniref:G-protein coupled receptors family 1 profile domain-containing protein n=1 Tax=Capitella teleta TaxID=283909 RepID=R7UGK8_CAPTE|nr:hypothetical protein CAPTEDRAFT_217519 [Capitella teleta]|eukprot:ELU05669.1 hypothetical protein CAPTEDRAFT_217519 [Capitella teleta]
MKLKTTVAWVGLLICVRFGAPSTVADDGLHSTAVPVEDNSSGSTQNVRMSESQKWVLEKIKSWELVISLMVSAAITVANAIIIMVMKRFKSFSVPHVYMIVMAFCDMNIGTFTAWRSVADYFSCRPEWFRSVCQATYWPMVGMETGSSSAAALVAMLLSIDRCIALKCPFQYTRLCSIRRAVILSILVNIAVGLLGINYPMRIAVPRAGYLVDSMIYFNNHRTLFHYEVFILFGNLWSKLNSLANIFIYLMLSEEFRKVFLSLFGCAKQESSIEAEKIEVREVPRSDEAEIEAEVEVEAKVGSDDEAVENIGMQRNEFAVRDAFIAEAF